MAPRSKSKELAENLKIQISSGVLRAGEQLDSIVCLAERHATTVATVSKAMDFLEQAGLVNRIPGKGIFVRQKKTCRIAVVLDRCFAYSTSAYSSLHVMLQEIDSQCRERDWAYELFPNVVDADSVQGFRGRLKQGCFDAVFIGSLYVAQNFDDIFCDQMVFTVGLYNYKELSYTVAFDTYRMVHEAALELHRLGCGEIALCDNDVPMEWSSSPDMTRRGFVDAMKRIGKLSGDILYRQIKISQQAGYEALKELWEKCEKPPLGVISNDSLKTLGMLQAVLSLGLRIPEDVIIATHANQGCESAQFAAPVIKFSNPIKEQFKTVFCRIQDFLQGEPPPFGTELAEPIKETGLLRKS